LGCGFNIWWWWPKGVAQYFNANAKLFCCCFHHPRVFVPDPVFAYATLGVGVTRHQSEYNNGYE
jgi:hypothetical protein